MKYNFYVANAADVDLPRIAKENPESNAILVSGRGDEALLMLRQSWLERFNFGDGFEVHEFLNPNWGYRILRPEQNGKGVTFSMGIGVQMDGWRCTRIKKSELTAAIATLKAANAYKRRLEVRVSQLL